MERVVATIQARMGSTRLPGKVLMPAAGKPLLIHMLERVRRCRYVDEIVVATTRERRDGVIAEVCAAHGIRTFRGSEEHVLERVVEAGRAAHADVSVLLTGDCPLVDPRVVDQHVCAFLSAYPHVDYVTNCEVRSFPHGLDVQVLRWATLAETLPLAGIPPFREHVGWYVRRHPERYRRLDVVAPPGLSNPAFRITLDYEEDYERIRAIYDALYERDPAFGTVEVLEYARDQKWIDA